MNPLETVRTVVELRQARGIKARLITALYIQKAMSTPFVEIKFQTKGVEYVALVSPEDEERVRAVRWYLMGGGYVMNLNKKSTSEDAVKMHALVMGDRPEGVPSDWVIDHKDRNRLNNTRDNLRWVPEKFNAWNCEKKRSVTYRGTSLTKNGRWTTCFAGDCYGTYDHERDAGRAYVKACVQEFGDLAATSDLIVGEGKGKFTAEEIEEIKAEIARGDVYARKVKDLPSGISLTGSGRYEAVCWLDGKKVHLGTYDTLDEAKAVYDSRMKKHSDKKWADHLANPITRDAEGIAIIYLTGTKGEGISVKVPEKLWHELTFDASWNFDGRTASGKWRCRTTGEKRGGHMQTTVWKLLHPEYVKSEELSVCFVNQEDTLDIRESNLQLSTSSGKCSNKKKASGCWSKYVGVTYDKGRDRWRGDFKLNGKKYVVYSQTEDGAYERLIAKRREMGAL